MRYTSRSSMALWRQLVIVGSLHLLAQQLALRPPSATTPVKLSNFTIVRVVIYASSRRQDVSKLVLIIHLVFDE